jgi:hypothetical protein
VKIALTVVGGILEFAGICLVAAPELTPRLARVWAQVGATVAGWWRLVGEHVFRLKREPVHHFGSSTVSGKGSASARGFAVVGEDTSIERQLEFLREFVERTEQRFGQIEDRVGGLAKEWNTDIETARREIESTIEQRVEEIRDAHIRLRLIGIGLLLLGVPILALANVV